MNIPKDTRSDSEVLIKELTLSFDGKPYAVPVLRRGPARKWRDEYLKRTREVADAMGMNLDENSPDLSKALGRALLKGLLEFPDAIPDLVAAYTGEAIPKEVIDNAYDQELQQAFLAIWGVAFRPFLSSLGMALETGQALRSPSAKSNAVN